MKTARRRLQGFTLIELMVAVAIVAVLAAIAYPSYVEHVARGKRADAKAALQENAQFLEAHYMSQGRYSTTTGSAPALPVASLPRNGGSAHYEISAEVTDTSYKLSASPVNSMAADGCGKLTLDQTGAQGASGALGAAVCWNR